MQFIVIITLSIKCNSKSVGFSASRKQNQFLYNFMHGRTITLVLLSTILNPNLTTVRSLCISNSLISPWYKTLALKYVLNYLQALLFPKPEDNKGMKNGLKHFVFTHLCCQTSSEQGPSSPTTLSPLWPEPAA